MKIIVCIGWTAKTRMSWYDTQMGNSWFKCRKLTRSAKDWVIRSTDETFDI